MDIAKVLTDILVVLVAAKVAAEGAERVGVPAVVGEILAGLLIGPSVLGLVGHQDDVLRTLGELGVILLLLEVGMEMDLGELGKVGRASLLVATVGVIVPMVLGIGAMQMLGEDFKTSLFVGAALTATSVGITARVFGDLGALATTEARIVLGAAVADDVMGLVVLTVVVRLVTEGSVSLLSVLGIVGLAVAFLVVGAGVGLRLSGPLFSAVNRFSLSTGTLVAFALAFALAFARIAEAAKLAPIVGAFVAGLALTRSDQSGRIRRELAPVGHLFIPVFFLQIGIDAQVGAFGRVEVLRDAALLLVVAVLGKLVSPLGAMGAPGDKLLIGLGMLPRGEVGLIFATIGLSTGVLGDDLYASLLLVVLLTTLATPQLLKMRYSRLRLERSPDVRPADPMPPGGWLRTDDGVVELAAYPPAEAGLTVALEAAVQTARLTPGGALLEWLSDLPPSMLAWRQDALDELLDVMERGNARSWRFLDTVAVLGAALPELAEAIRERFRDPFSLSPLEAYQFTGLEQLRRLDASDPLAIETQRLLHPNRLLFALLLVDVLSDPATRRSKATSILTRIGLDEVGRSASVELVADAELLWAAAVRAGGLDEDNVLQLASHLDTPDRARSLYALSALTGSHREQWELARLHDLHGLIQDVLEHDELAGGAARDLIGKRRDEAAVLAGASGGKAERIASAPRGYVLRQTPAAIARHANILEPPLTGDEVRVRSTQLGPGEWSIDVAARDRHGLLAAVTAVLATHEFDVREAVVATWPDAAALESFHVSGSVLPDEEALSRDIHLALRSELASQPLAGAIAIFDQLASPWHTACDVIASDRPGLLHDFATAFAAARVVVVTATITNSNGTTDDRFELVDTNGRKLSPHEEEAVRRFLEGGVVTTRKRFRRVYGTTAELGSRARQGKGA